MSDEHIPKHLRGLPRGAKLTPDEEREHMDLQTNLDRIRRKHLSETEGEPWAFPVPRSMALLFDLLSSPFIFADALEAGEELGMNAGAVEEALKAMRHHELVSNTPNGYVKHLENRNWF